MCVCVLRFSTKLKTVNSVTSLSLVRLSVTPWTIAYQAPPSMGFSRQEYWSRVAFLLQRIFPTQGWNPGLPHCRQTLYCLSHQGSQINEKSIHKNGMNGDLSTTPTPSLRTGAFLCVYCTCKAGGHPGGTSLQEAVMERL